MPERRASATGVVHFTMRLRPDQARTICQVAREIAGPAATVRLFGSRLDDTARGGDIDLLVEVPEPVAHPAMLGARIEARLMRALDGRKVDVVLAAPNLRRQSIHEVAAREGQPLC